MSVATQSQPVRTPLAGGSLVVGDLIFRLICGTAAASVIVVFVVLTVYLVIEAWPSISHFGLAFLITNDWDPQYQRFGSLAFVFGTLWTSGMAILLAVPLGVATAAFLAEIAPPLLRRIGSFLIELLAAIPSVVYGFWAITFLTPLVRKLFLALGAPVNVDGKSLFTAGLVLAIMILPYITAIAFDVCRAVPRSQREGSLALGATRWQTIWSVVLPYARPGIIGGCFLALGRALGETMAVIMVVGNVPQINFAPYAAGATIPSKIASGLNEMGGLQRSALVELGVILLLVTMVVNGLARLLIWRMGQPRKTSPRRDAIQQLVWRRILPGLFLLMVAYLAVRLVSGLVSWDVDGAGIFALTLVFAGMLITLGMSINALLHRSKAGSIHVNRLMTGVLGACLLITCGPLFLILGYMTVNGVESLDLDFFRRLPNDEPPGLAHAIYGSAVLVFIATVLAVPVGLLAAIFLAENPTSYLSKTARFVGELLGGVPSIVIGIFAYALLVAEGGLLSWFTGAKFTAWAGAFALAVMMIPVVMRSSEEALKLVPASLRHASFALGAARWQTVLRVAVPAAIPTIITGICLAIARIAGETAPLLLTVNQTSYWPKSLFSDYPYLTYYIYYYSVMSADPVENRLAWAAAFVLLAVVMVVNIGIRLLTGRRVMQATRAD
jgi:phosphate transport system permease protein